MVTVKSVGVVGCGVMGSGIAQVCAQAGYQVLVVEKQGELLQKGLSSIGDSLAKQVEKGRLPQSEMHAIVGRISGVADLSALASCEVVIEAVPEALELKKEVFAHLDRICPPGVLLVSNTSTLSIIELAMATSRPSQVVGLHFFNPPPVMKLVEIVRSLAANDDTIAVAKAFAESLGKKVVIAPDYAGYLVNRLSTPLLLTAVQLLEQGYATREDIDVSMQLGMNHPMGPLALLDLIGLDTFLVGAAEIYNETRDPRYAPPQLLTKMVAAGLLGRKSGQGFYDYQ